MLRALASIRSKAPDEIVSSTTLTSPAIAVRPRGDPDERAADPIVTGRNVELEALARDMEIGSVSSFPAR